MIWGVPEGILRRLVCCKQQTPPWEPAVLLRAMTLGSPQRFCSNCDMSNWFGVMTEGCLLEENKKNICPLRFSSLTHFNHSTWVASIVGIAPCCMLTVKRQKRKTLALSKVWPGFFRCSNPTPLRIASPRCLRLRFWSMALFILQKDLRSEKEPSSRVPLQWLTFNLFLVGFPTKND